MARILVLDDVLEAVRAIEMILAKNGHETIGCTDENDAIEQVRSNPVDLAILDIKLKHRDGLEVLEEMKRIRPELKVIMLTGYPTHRSAEESTRLGADAYCVKPIDRQELEKRVRDLLP